MIEHFYRPNCHVCGTKLNDKAKTVPTTLWLKKKTCGNCDSETFEYSDPRLTLKISR